MKKLNKKEMRNIKAGSIFGKISGALVSAIGTVIKVTFDGVCKVIDTVEGWKMGFQEAGKNHAKMSLKVGDASMSYDDTTKIKSAEDLAEAQMKKGVTNPANPKHIVLADQAKGVDLIEHHSADEHHFDNPAEMLDDSMHMIDDFMHF